MFYYSLKTHFSKFSVQIYQVLCQFTLDYVFCDFEIVRFKHGDFHKSRKVINGYDYYTMFSLRHDLDEEKDLESKALT